MRVLDRHRRIPVVLAGAALLTLAVAPAAAAQPGPAPRCSPTVSERGFSDALNKAEHHGVEVGGLSSLAFDARSRAWASTVDNHGRDPARIWFFTDLADPVVARDPLVLEKPDGTPYLGTDSDNEGLAVLPDGDYLVSSETEPSIRIFGRDGAQKAALPVPARFGVAGGGSAGQATANATLEGLTISRSGREIVAAMEGALAGDVSASGDASLHRFLVYTTDRHGQWRLARQVGYRAEPGMRVPEVAAYGEDSLLVEEAAFDAATGNSVNLFAVTGLDHAPDVGPIANLSAAPARDVMRKRPVAELVNCPPLGATAPEHQTNPLLDNYEGMAVNGNAGGLTGVSLISDDNFSATQTTRVLNLVARLP
ncbi:esterase-like activity of phytase family protein [Amycolatopsis acidiphila]|uniref:Esterase-like activity of phytase family protein n=1 Tax=Amycolatopsis acidiphila TaxID=715473 RepID=A0A557ZYT3_9PSEU|nr:esterase-like activity of phytase family protein [Amycolatopsis acidiphila]TVT17178.1 esterase-like activity of phytase family protein [Amycolatopsis acidiphila]UIJ63061.1 esterase-like activity of phytase family protein [Amycolatopsis acidiphila]GHG65912.1 hypothetical protein GCM10017788_23750 [Amycolatopsis acidiphila]